MTSLSWLTTKSASWHFSFLCIVRGVNKLYHPTYEYSRYLWVQYPLMCLYISICMCWLSLTCWYQILWASIRGLIICLLSLASIYVRLDWRQGLIIIGTLFTRINTLLSVVTKVHLFFFPTNLYKRFGNTLLIQVKSFSHENDIFVASSVEIQT